MRKSVRYASLAVDYFSKTYCSRSRRRLSNKKNQGSVKHVCIRVCEWCHLLSSWWLVSKGSNYCLPDSINLPFLFFRNYQRSAHRFLHVVLSAAHSSIMEPCSKTRCYLLENMPRLLKPWTYYTSAYLETTYHTRPEQSVLCYQKRISHLQMILYYNEGHYFLQSRKEHSKASAKNIISCPTRTCNTFLF